MPQVEYTPSKTEVGKKRAIRVSEMYTISPTDFNFDHKYVIGQQQIVSDSVYQFKNVTFNADLILNIVLPPHTTMNLEPSTLVKPGQEISIVIQFNKENATNQFIADRQEVSTTQTQWSVKPVNFTGPVYIPL